MRPAPRSRSTWSTRRGDAAGSARCGPPGSEPPTAGRCWWRRAPPRFERWFPGERRPGGGHAGGGRCRASLSVAAGCRRRAASSGWLLPAACLLCDGADRRAREGDALVCGLCRLRWRPVPDPLCPRCGQPRRRRSWSAGSAPDWPAGPGAGAERRLARRAARARRPPAQVRGLVAGGRGAWRRDGGAGAIDRAGILGAGAAGRPAAAGPGVQPERAPRRGARRGGSACRCAATCSRGCGRRRPRRRSPRKRGRPMWRARFRRGAVAGLEWCWWMMCSPRAPRCSRRRRRSAGAGRPGWRPSRLRGRCDRWTRGSIAGGADRQPRLTYLEETRWPFESGSTASAASDATLCAPPRRWGATELDFVAVNDLTDTRRSRTCSSTTRCTAASRATVDADADGLVVDGDTIRVLCREGPGQAPVEGPRRRRRARVAPAASPTGSRPPRTSSGGRQEGDHLRAGQEGGHHHRLRRQPREVRSRQAPRHLQRQLHHQLPGAGGEGHHRQLRLRERLHDHRPLLHQRPADPRPAAQGSAPGPRRGAVDHSDHHRRGQGHLAGHSRGEGQDRRRLAPGADARRLAGRADLRGRRRPRRPTRSTRPSARPRPRARSRASSR